MNTPLSVLEEQALKQPDAPAIIYLDNPTDHNIQVMTYAELVTRVKETAQACIHAGITKNDIVALQLLATPEAIISLFAVMSVACAFPINILLNQEAFEAQIEEAGVRHIFTMGDYPQLPLASKVQALKTKPDLVVEIPIPNYENQSRPKASSSWDSFIAHADTPLEIPKRQDNENTIVFSTGGTTGKPKLALISCRAAIEGAKIITTGTGTTDSDRILSGFPLFHVGGTIAVSLSAMTSGTAIVQVSPIGARHPDFVPQIWQMTERLKLTIISAVPTSHSVISTIPVGDHDISSLRALNTGGSKMPVSIAEKLEAMTGVELHEMYGMTECSAAGIMNHRGRRILGSAGEPMQGVSIAIGDPLNPFDTGIEGEIFINSPGNFSGYLGGKGDDHGPNNDQNEQITWVATGDLGYISENGRLYVSGRSKDLIIRSGHNIQPIIIEEVAETHPDVIMAAAVAYPDEYAGEVPALFVQLKEDAILNTDDLLSYIQEKISEPPAKPKYIFPIKAMPMTNVGKIFKPKLREMIKAMAD
jgi:fatty-acyl-CoA synthase